MAITYSALRDDLEKELRKSGRKIDFNENEAVDLFLLETYVKPHYKPSEKPLAMVVGALTAKEADVIRLFHERTYQIPERETTVVGCNRSIVPENFEPEGFDSTVLGVSMRSYDFKALGPFHGDARFELTWFKPFVDTEEEPRKYDFVYIRNPYFVDITDWSIVFYRALEFLTEQGVVVTVIRQDDEVKYKTLVRALKSDCNIEPLLTVNPGIIDNITGVHFHHTLSLYKRQGTHA